MISKPLETLHVLLRNGNPMMSFALGMKSTSKQSRDGLKEHLENTKDPLVEIVTLLSKCYFNSVSHTYPDPIMERDYITP